MLPTEANPIAELFRGAPYERKRLNWICFDSVQIVASLVHQSLQAWSQGRHVAVHRVPEHERTPGDPSIGMIVMACWRKESCAEFALSISKLRADHPSVMIVVCVGESCLEYRSHFIQAGAQVVVYPLFKLREVVTRLADRIPLQLEVHPLFHSILGSTK